VFKKLDIKYEVFGDNIYSTCPVHESSDNPRAFSYSKKRGIWKCWTRECQDEYRNDIFGLIRGILSNRSGSSETFGSVLKWLKQEFDIETDNKESVILTTSTDEDKELDFDTLVGYINDDVFIPQMTDCILNIDMKIPSKYFIDRGFKASTLKHFEVGDCMDKSSKLYERAIVPIHSDDGNQTIGYICRSIKEYKIPKFLIYPKGFDKRFVFYNTHRALPFIRENNCAIIVEGQGDVWRLYESGVYNVLGMFGRVLTREQQKKLQQLPITHIIVLTDNDQAGRESKIQLQRQLGRFYRLSFPQLSHKDIGDMSIKQIHSNILSQIRG
jgi:5S rRNA maturation endonuclease (ribonuclease M5)